MRLIAHRGASREAHENTMEAFRLAWELGADGAELDAQLTRDGRVVVIHDETTLRTTGVNLRVADTPWTGLVALGNIPLLAEVLDHLPAGKTLMIEIKCGPTILSPLSDELRRRKHRRDDVSLLCFDASTLSAAKLQLPGHRTFLNVEPARCGQRQTDLTFDGISLGDGPGLDQTVIDNLHAAGQLVAVWTVDDPARARALRDAGVDYLMTNDPRNVRP